MCYESNYLYTECMCSHTVGAYCTLCLYEIETVKSEISEGRKNSEQLTQLWKYQMYVGVYDSIVAPTAVMLHFKQRNNQ